MNCAAWRYGDQFGRRRRRALGLGAVGYAVGSVIAPAVSAMATVALVPGYLALLRWYPYAKVRLGGEAADSGGCASPSGSPDQGDASSSSSATPSCRNAKHLK